MEFKVKIKVSHQNLSGLISIPGTFLQTILIEHTGIQSNNNKFDLSLA